MLVIIEGVLVGQVLGRLFGIAFGAAEVNGTHYCMDVGVHLGDGACVPRVCGCSARGNVMVIVNGVLEVQVIGGLLGGMLVIIEVVLGGLLGRMLVIIEVVLSGLCGRMLVIVLCVLCVSGLLVIVLVVGQGLLLHHVLLVVAGSGVKGARGRVACGTGWRR